MEFRILGPLEVIGDDGRPVELPRRKSRALLGLLLLHANSAVSTDRLIDALWGDEPPRTATASLQNAVSRLRRAIGSEVVVSRQPGYELRVDADQVDVKRFERLVREAKSAEAGERAAKLREALALWRGEPLADLADEPFAAPEIDRLDDARAAATEEWIDAELALGGDADLIAEVETVIARHPLRERPRGQLMLALYRAGRQGEALEAYREARAYLVAELGVEPGEELQALERAILRQDPALAAQRRAVVPSFDAARKRVTALVVELTAPGADPERLRETLERFADDVRITVQRHGGHMHAATGDTLTALFGVPVAREDDALRAVRAARVVAGLEVADAEVRVTVDTGEAFVRGETVTGEAPANAQRLLDAAAPGDVVLGAATLTLVRNAVDASRIEGVRARGRALDAFRVVSLEDDAPPIARKLDAPLVGRRHELARLEDELRLAFSERRCRVVTLVGEAGIGKSRLARELVERTVEAAVLVGRCVSYGEGATYLPLADVVRRAVPEGTEEAIAAKLPDEERALVAERIAGLVGISDTVVPGGDAFWAVRRFLEALAREQPSIVFFDDVHWAEPTFLDLVEHLRDWIEDAPLLLLCAARPELLEARPAWGASAIVLGRLADDESRTLVDTLAEGLADEQRARVVESAEGNPLYLEQLVAAMAEGDEEIPSSIEALLAGRLDRLAADDRALLQRASVIGREFDVGALARLTDEDTARLTARLGALARSGLVRSRGAAFRFHHVLTRNAAYASIPKELRAELHARVATLATADEVIGFHLETAHGYGVELGAEDSDLASSAGTHLGRAGMRAFARGDAPAAQGLLERAVRLLDERDPAGIELRCELGIVRWISGRDDAMSTLREAQALAMSIADRRLELRAQLELAFVGLYGKGEIDAQAAIEIAHAAIPTFEEFEDDRALGRAWYLAASVESSFFCRNGESVDAIERAITHYRRADFPPSVCVAHLASALHFGPTPIPLAIARCRALLTNSEAGRNGEAVVRMWLGALEGKLGRFPAARSLLEDAKEAFRQLGQAGSVAGVESVRGEVELLAGNGDDAVRRLVAACTSYEQLGLTPNLSTEGAHLAEVLLGRDQVDEARAWLEKAEQHAEPGDVSAQFSCRVARARLAVLGGDLVAAERAAREAVELVDSTDALNQRATVRLTLAHVLDAAGRHDEAATVRATALELFEAKGNLVAADATRAILAGIPA